MSSTITPAFKSITFSDGTRLEFEPLRGGGPGGWWYKPDHIRTPDEIRNNKNRSFGRGDDGYDKAFQWMQEQTAKIKPYLLRHKVVDFEEWGNDAEPDKSGISIAWKNKWGWQYVKFSSYRGDTAQITVGISPILFNIHQILSDARTNYEFRHHTEGSMFRNESRYGQKTPITADEAFDKFLDDPVGFTKSLQLKVPATFWNGCNINQDIEWEATEDWEPLGNGVQYYVSKSTLLTNKSIAKEYMIENLDELKTLLDCIYTATGAQIDVRTRWMDDSYEKSMLDQVKFVLQSDNEFKTPHTIMIDVDTGVSVRCGYEDDDERYAEWQRRQAMDFFDEVKETETDDDDTDEWLSQFNL